MRFTQDPSGNNMTIHISGLEARDIAVAGKEAVERYIAGEIATQIMEAHKQEIIDSIDLSDLRDLVVKEITKRLTSVVDKNISMTMQKGQYHE